MLGLKKKNKLSKKGLKLLYWHKLPNAQSGASCKLATKLTRSRRIPSMYSKTGLMLELALASLNSFS